MIDLQPPRFAQHPPTVLAGVAVRFSRKTKHQIPALWQRFAPYIGTISGQVGVRTYGVCSSYHPDGSFEYLCAVAISGTQSLPADLKTFEIPSKTNAVFSHLGNISGLSETWQAIFSQWLPTSGCTLEKEPNFEVYTEEFDPRSGTGLVEVWIPLKEGCAA